MEIRSDILIAGGGPAGLAAAIALRRERFSVTLVDPGFPPMDRPCGEGLLPDGVEILQHLGVKLPSEKVRFFSGIRYIDKGTIATGRFPQGQGAGIRRTLLHQLMTAKAAGTGARLLWGEKVCRITAEGAELSHGSVRARWIVAADGKNSSIRHQLGLDGRVRNRRIGIRRHYRIEPWSHMVEVFWGLRAEAYVTPVGDREICVAILTSEPKPRFHQVLGRFPALMSRLRGAEISSTDRGADITFRHARGVVKDRVALL
ncbi:MAG: NAD(P)/FAD-dependent oxidoreductase, partial [Acidobacteriota bacterium]